MRIWIVLLLLAIVCSAVVEGGLGKSLKKIGRKFDRGLRGIRDRSGGSVSIGSGQKPQGTIQISPVG